MVTNRWSYQWTDNETFKTKITQDELVNRLN